MSKLRQLILQLLGKKVQALAEGKAPSPTDKAIAKALFLQPNLYAEQIESYISTAYGDDDSTDGGTVSSHVDTTLTLMQELGIIGE